MFAIVLLVLAVGAFVWDAVVSKSLVSAGLALFAGYFLARVL